MKKTTLLCLVLSFFLKASMSQETHFRNLYFETGADFVICEPPDDKSYIRADVVRYSYYYEKASYVMALLYKNYYGIKFEYRFLNNHLGFTSGVRYTRTEASIGKETYWSSKAKYFYLFLDSDETTTNFLRVRSISQIGHYMGIPLELRIYPYRERKVQIYYKIGLDFNFILADKTEVAFHERTMNKYTENISNIIEDPWKFYGTAGLAIGMKIGDTGKPGVNIEACFPSGILHSSTNSFVSPTYGSGFQLNIRFPL